jgi:hypothetical protein
MQQRPCFDKRKCNSARQSLCAGEFIHGKTARLKTVLKVNRHQGLTRSGGSGRLGEWDFSGGSDTYHPPKLRFTGIVRDGLRHLKRWTLANYRAKSGVCRFSILQALTI